MENYNGISILKHEGMNLCFIGQDKPELMSAFTPGVVKEQFASRIASPPFQVTIAGRPYNYAHSAAIGYGDLPYAFKLVHVEESSQNKESNKDLKLIYKHEETGLCIHVDITFPKDAAVARFSTSIINEGKEPAVIRHLSSFFIQGIVMDGLRKWSDSQKVKLHYCRQGWHGEGQWRSSTLEEMGLYPAPKYNCGTSVLVSSVGSYSTFRYLPMAVIEDVESGQCWYFQIETSASWNYAIGFKGSDENDRGSLFVEAFCADERHGGWSKTLAPGECFAAPSAAIGCTHGGFDEAIKELTKYRRSMLKPSPAWDSEECPLVFNDFMNCLWGQPTEERLLPLIDTAAKAGAEVFCIDAGWFGDKESPHAYAFCLGDWEPSKDRFETLGVQGILSVIKDKGMIPGIWLEMEVCGEKSNLAHKPEDWFLQRDGIRVGGGMRYFLNFTHPQVREYLHGIIDGLVDMGVRYIKNDYNDDIGLGADLKGSNYADGLLQTMEAFYSFIDEVRAKHPGLILENCGSGALREDYGILSHFHLQSSSDQVEYTRYPSVLSGSLAAVLPEQLGIWSYPYPINIQDYSETNKLIEPEYKERMENGEETVFNMVSGMCGNLYLSGHIDFADQKNFNLICEGINLYKKERNFIHNAYPLWPLGFNRVNDMRTWAVVGLENEDATRFLLAVWRIDAADEVVQIPIKKLAGKQIKVKCIYPQSDSEFKVDSFYNKHTGSLSVKIPISTAARMFEIEVDAT